MGSGKFVKNNQGFVCKNCGKKVPSHPSSSRNHCPECLFSLHLDINPGDRRNLCHGLLEPIGIKLGKGKSQIVYHCLKCGKGMVNIIAPDDNQEKLVEISTLPIK